MNRLKKTKDSFTEVSGKKKNLRQQLKEHDSDSHKCDVCTESFKTKSALKSHTNVHSKSMLYNCETCKRGFAQKGTMLRHQNKCPHLIIECEYCGDFLAQKTAFKKHLCPQQTKTMDIVRSQDVTQDRPTCDKCGKSFAQKYNLKTHKMIHSRNNQKSSRKLKMPEGQPCITSFLRSKSTNVLKSKTSTPVKKPKTPSKMTMITRSAKKPRRSLPVKSTKSPSPAKAKQTRKSLPANITIQNRKSLSAIVDKIPTPAKAKRKSVSAKITKTIVPVRQSRRSLPARLAKTPDQAKQINKSVSSKITKILTPAKQSRRSLPNKINKTPIPAKQTRKSLTKPSTASKITKTPIPAKQTRKSLTKYPSPAKQNKRSLPAKITKTPIPAKQTRKSLTKPSTASKITKTPIPAKKTRKSLTNPSTPAKQSRRSLPAKISKTPIPAKQARKSLRLTKTPPIKQSKIIVSANKPKTAASANRIKTPISAKNTKTSKPKKIAKNKKKPAKLSIYSKPPKSASQNNHTANAKTSQNNSVRASKIARIPIEVKRCKVSLKEIPPPNGLSPDPTLDSSLGTTAPTKIYTFKLADDVSKTPVKSSILLFGKNDKTPKTTRYPKTPTAKTPKVLKHAKTPSAKTPATSKIAKTPKVLNNSKTPTTSKFTNKSKVNNVLKNPFLQSILNKNHSRKSEPIARTNINDMIKNPRTIKERRLNNEILSDFHKDHSDDMFGNVNPPSYVSRLNLLDSPNSSSPLIKTKSKTPLASLVNNFDGWSADTPGYLKATDDQGITPKQGSDSDFGHLAFVQRAVKNRRVPAVKRKSLFPQPRSRSMDSYVAELEPALKKFRGDPQEDPEDDEIEAYFEEEKENDAQGSM